MKRRHTFIAVAGLLAATLAISTVWAATTVDFGTSAAPTGAHFRQGAGPVSCALGGAFNLSLICTGTAIAGVGNTNAVVDISITYAATVQCRNNGGKIVDVKTQLTAASQPAGATELKNGSLFVSPITVAGPTVTQTFLDAATCPNPNWDKVLLGSPAVTSFIYTLTFEGYTDPVITVTGP